MKLPVLGQPRAVATLDAALRSGRMHHAWIFAGPRGVGKFTTARELAKVLLDPAGSGDPAGETVRLIEAGSHPDLHVIHKELAAFSDNARLRGRKLLNIPFDVLRERMIGGHTGDGKYREAPAFKTALLNHGKVFIIDEAELLDEDAQNALLKTLEEPPPRTYMFLITTRPQRLLPTIRSRCQLASFGPLDEQAMQAWFDRSGLELGRTERTWIERFSAGSPGLAQLAAAYGLPAWQKTLSPMLAELAAGGFPAAMGQAMIDLVEAFATAWVADHANASKDAANREGARYVLMILAANARGRLHQAINAGEDAGGWLAAIELIDEAERQITGKVNYKLVLENLVAQWCAAA